LGIYQFVRVNTPDGATDFSLRRGDQVKCRLNVFILQSKYCHLSGKSLRIVEGHVFPSHRVSRGTALDHFFSPTYPQEVSNLHI